MEEITLLGVLGAVIILIATILIFYATRDTNSTKRFIATEEKEKQKLKCEIQHEGKKMEVLSNERIEERKAQCQEELKKMDVVMHSASVSVQKLKEERKLDETNIICASKLKMNERQCQTVQNLAEMEIGFKKSELESKDSKFRLGLEYQEKFLNSNLSLESKKLKLSRDLGQIEANTMKYVTDSKMKTQLSLSDKETERAALRSEMKLKLGLESASVLRERNSLMAKCTEKQISSTENCFRDQIKLNFAKEEGKIELARLKNSEAQANMFGKILTTASGGIGGILGNAIGGKLTGKIGSNGLSTPSLIASKTQAGLATQKLPRLKK